MIKLGVFRTGWSRQGVLKVRIKGGQKEGDKIPQVLLKSYVKLLKNRQQVYNNLECISSFRAVTEYHCDNILLILIKLNENYY